MATILGKKLMLFVKNDETYTSIAYATNHTFTTSASTVSVASKDDADVSGAGKWDAQDLDMFSWSISAENLFAYEGNGMTCDKVMELYLAGKPIEVKFGLAQDSLTGAPEKGWEQAATTATVKMLSGQAYITSLDINASNDGRATMSITLTGKGAVEYK
jgi:TP901-1 family phage major tail protein